MSEFAPLPIDLERLHHTAILASAGSGKTYQLVNRYVRLLAAGAVPSSIVASTFTRLAAGQIRDRVMRKLAEAVDDPKSRKALATDLGLKSLSATEATQLLVRLARHLHTVQIRTLDSFFASVVRCFAIELKVPPDARVVDEDEARQLREEAMRRMLDEQDPQHLVDLLRLLTQGDANRSVLDSIDGVVTQLGAIAGEAPDAAWECIPLPRGRLKPAQLEEAIAGVSDLIIPEDKAQLFKAWVNDCERIHRRDWKALIGQGIAASVLQRKEKYGSSKLMPEIIAAYQPLVAHARAELVGRLRQQTIATRDLLRLYEQHHEAVKRNAKAVTFDDLTKAMGRADELGTTDEIGFRLDSKLHHLLLDEFQDTSLGQWLALEPMVHEIVSNAAPERTFFCVGDVKQSIYGWRNAAPQVLQSLPSQLPGIQVDRLSRSYRSSPIIMNVVNQVFCTLRRNDAVSGFAQPVEEWLQGFDEHDTDKKDRPGYAEVKTVRRAEKGEDKLAIRLAAAARLVGDMHRARPDLSIAVLTRSNRAVARMFFELGPSRQNLVASGRGGGPLTDAPAVNAILDLLQLADHPDDTAAAFHVANSPLGPAIGLTAHDDLPQRHRVARRVRADLLNRGYRAVVSEWVSLVADKSDSREARRLLHLVELAGRHDARATLRPGDFIRVVESTRVADVQPASVQVMTLHQAKGLEFDIVVLPELDTSFTANSRSMVVFDRQDELGPIARICRHMSKEVRELVPELEPLFIAHEHRLIREQLSLLYVALTRSKHALHVLVDPARDGEKTMPKSPAGVLRSALAAGAAEPESVLHAQGDPSWFKAISPSAAPAVTVSAAPAVTLASPLPEELAMAQRGLTAISASASEVHGRSFADDLAFVHQDARDRGTAMHALFEMIGWVDEFDLDDARLIDEIREQMPRRCASWAAERVHAFRASLKRPSVRQILSSPAESAMTIELHPEFPFARLVSGRVQSGFIDRLEIHRDVGGRAVGARIIDFKTDEIDESEIVARVETYRPQLKSYRDAVAEMFNLRPEAVSMTLLFLALGVCRPID